MPTELKDVLTVEQVTPVIEAVVAEFGEDYVYPQREPGMCTYTTPDGSPDCLVGHVMHRLGVDISDWDASPLGDTAFDGICFDRGASTSEFTLSPVAEALVAAQRAQDNGYHWGKALREYRKALHPAGGAL